MMKKTLSYLLCLLVLGACARTVETGKNDAAKRYFDAWMQVNHPGLTPTGLGAYVLSDKEGGGAGVGESDKYVRVNYTLRSLDGNVSATTWPDLAKQLGTWRETSWFGPVIWTLGEGRLSAGLDEMISSMRAGGRREAVIPGWLMTTSRYGSAEEYLGNVTGNNAIYEVELLESIEDMDKWELDSLARFFAADYPALTVKDSLKYGFYYLQTKAPAAQAGTDGDKDKEEEKSDAGFPADTTIYINYTGRLLNGRVFDTTVADTAKMYGIYSSSKTYSPISVQYNHDDYTGITITSSKSSVIDGFSYMLWRMGPFEAGTGIFLSKLGYAASGSGSSIPAYSPLRFDIEVVEKP